MNALQGLGDTARQHDQHEAAAQLLTAAIDLAANDGYRFGEVRALVSLGYLTMAVSSAHESPRLLHQQALNHGVLVAIPPSAQEAHEPHRRAEPNQRRAV